MQRPNQANTPLLASAADVAPAADYTSMAVAPDPAPYNFKKTAYEVHSPRVYNLAYANAFFWGIAAFLGEAGFGIFARTYTAIGTTYLLQLIDESIPDLPPTYGDVSSLKTFFQTALPVAETAGWLAVVSEIVNGVTQFELRSIAKASAESTDIWVHAVAQQGVCASFCKWGSDTLSSSSAGKITFNAISYAMFAGSSIAMSYGDLEQIKKPFQDWMGDIMGNIALAYLGGGAMFYCIKAFLSKTEKGMEFIWGGSGFGERYKNHGSIAIEVQYVLEGAVTVSVRAGSLSFLCGRLAEQFGFDPGAYYGLGGAAGFAQGAQCFLPGTYRKYHGFTDGKFGHLDEEKHELPVTQSERDKAKQDIYGQMSGWNRAIHEFKRAFFIGAAQSGMSAYFFMTYAEPTISKALTDQGCPKELATLVTYTLTTAVAAIAYIPFYKASEYAALNEHAHKARVQSIVPPITESSAEEKTVEHATPIIEDDNEKEKERQPSCCARFFGKAASFVSQATRIPTLVASLIRNGTISKALPRKDWAAIGMGAGAMVGDNRYRVMTDSSIEAMDKLRCDTKVTKQGLFATRARVQPPVKTTAATPAPSQSSSSSPK